MVRLICADLIGQAVGLVMLTVCPYDPAVLSSAVVLDCVPAEPPHVRFDLALWQPESPGLGILDGVHYLHETDAGAAEQLPCAYAWLPAGHALPSWYRALVESWGAFCGTKWWGGALC